MKPLDRVVVTVLVAALALVAGGMLVPESSWPLPVQAPYREPAAIHEGVVGHPESITPLTAASAADRDLVALLFRGLTHVGPGGGLQPDLARSWSVAADGKSYTFVLRRDASWEDGEPVTAADVAFTIGLLRDPGYAGPLAAAWRDVQVVQLDTYVVRFDLGLVKAGFLQATTLPLLPQHLLSGIGVDELATSDYAANPMGDGFFRLAELDSDHALLERVRSVDPVDPASRLGQLRASPAATPTTLPSLRRPTIYETLSDFELRFFDDEASATAAYRAGSVDAIGGLTASSVEAALAVPGSRLLRYPRTALTTVLLNQRGNHPEFRSADARRGLLAAIDRDALVSVQLAGHGTRADIPLAPSSWAYDRAAVTPIAHDPAAARADLIRAGWTYGPGGWTPARASGPLAIELLAPDEATNPTAYATAVAVAADWRAIGLTVTVRALSSANYVKALSGADFQAAIVDVDIGLDPDLCPLLLASQAGTGGLNVSGVQNPALDKLLLATRSAPDLPSRRGALADLERYLADSEPMLALYFDEYDFVAGERLQGVTTHEIADPSGRYWDVLDWRLASDR